MLIEKPISNDQKGLEQLNNAAVKNNCVLMVGYNLRFLASLIKFKSLIDNYGEYIKRIFLIFLIFISIGIIPGIIDLFKELYLKFKLFNK